MGDRNAQTVIWDALRGALVTRALGLAADLRLAQALEAGPRSYEALARARGVDADTLQRVLRALASDGIFEETEPGVFRNTAASALLTRDGWDDLAHLFGGSWMQAVTALDASGELSFPRVHGSEFWAWLAARPQERAAFDRAMGQGWQTRLARLENVGWRGDELVVDVGGGSGSLLFALLERHPRMRGIVFDLPDAVRDEQALGDRCTFVEGSFFESVPHGEVHLLSTILHDWDDRSAQQVLETIRGAAGERLVILDSVIEPGNAPDGAKWLDLLMLVIAGGRERTAEQWQVLLANGSWRPTRIGEGVIEAQPA
jgi:O-methyltransferase domain